MKDILTHLAISNIDIIDTENKNLTNSADDTVKNQLTTNVIDILNAIIGVLGLLAVVIIILGGVQYMTSSGDAGKVKKAKDTILYGIIGLVIVALAFAIVNFVIGNILAQS
jgi:TRAP-type C4-dicarboxylate transport system permease small subunit